MIRKGKPFFLFQLKNNQDINFYLFLLFFVIIIKDIKKLISRGGNMKNQDIKFLLNQDQANFYKFHLILKKFYNVEFSSNEYFNFCYLMGKIFKMNVLKINDIEFYKNKNQNKINTFIDEWEGNFKLW